MGPDSGRQKNKMIHCFRGPVRMSATSWSSSSSNSRKVWYPSTTIYIFADNDLTTCLTYLFNLHDFVSACIIFHCDLSALDRSRRRTDWTGLVDRRTDRQPDSRDRFRGTGVVRSLRRAQWRCVTWWVAAWRGSAGHRSHLTLSRLPNWAESIVSLANFDTLNEWEWKDKNKWTCPYWLINHSRKV